VNKPSGHLADEWVFRSESRSAHLAILTRATVSAAALNRFSWCVRIRITLRPFLTPISYTGLGLSQWCGFHALLRFRETEHRRAEVLLSAPLVDPLLNRKDT
jgi:hypothetical protein